MPDTVIGDSWNWDLSEGLVITAASVGIGAKTLALMSIVSLRATVDVNSTINNPATINITGTSLINSIGIAV